MRKSMIFLSVLMLLSIHLLTTPAPAYACSGEPIPFEYLVDASPVIARARVTHLDAASRNAIVEVSQYFKGDISINYLVVEQTTPLMWATKMEFEIQGLFPCRTAGIALEIGDEAFFFLKRTDSGSYAPALTYNYNITIYTIQPRVPRTVNWIEPTDESQFARQIVDLVKRPPQAPISFYPLPYTAPLWITTKSGANYLLPLDWGEPHRMSKEEVTWARAQQRRGCFVSDGPGCIATSYKSVVTMCKTILCLPDAYHDPLDINHRKTIVVNPIAPGEAFLFSPVGFNLANWQGEVLQIYTASPVDYGRKLVAAKPISTAVNVPSKGAWSPDGRYLGYSDVRGLWLWDLSDTAFEPRLLIPVDDYISAPSRLPFPLYFSPGGRYLAVEQNELIFTLDIITGNQFPGGVVSPDDLRLLTFRSMAESDYRPEVCTLGHPCGVGVSSLDYQVRQPTWLSDSDYSYLLCKPGTRETSEVCSLRSGTLAGNVRDEPAIAFATEELSKDLAILQDARTLIIRRNNAPEYKIDLIATVGEEVAAIAWTPSIMNGPIHGLSPTQRSLEWSPDGAMLAISDNAGQIQILDSKIKAILHTFEVSRKQHSISWRPDSQQLATTGGEDGILRIWDIKRGAQIAAYHEFGAGSLCWSSPDTLFYLAGIEGKTWGKINPINGHDTLISAMPPHDWLIQQHPTQQLLLFGGGWPLTIIDISAAEPKEVKEFEMEKAFPGKERSSAYFLNALAWSHENTFAIADYLGQVFVMRIDADRPFYSYLLPSDGPVPHNPRPKSAILALTFAGNDSWLYALRNDGTLLVFSLFGIPSFPTRNPSHAIQLTTEQIQSAQFSPDGKRLALALEESGVQIVDIPEYLTRPG